MLQTNFIKNPICEYKDCSNNAIYEFSDIILEDSQKELEERELATVVIAHSCDDHYINMREKYAK
tara:strand:+ start:56 stop:250 length:195 start_codon:yes stop_codon:yes gene_type:complete